MCISKYAYFDSLLRRAFCPLAHQSIRFLGPFQASGTDPFLKLKIGAASLLKRTSSVLRMGHAGHANTELTADGHEPTRLVLGSQIALLGRKNLTVPVQCSKSRSRGRFRRC